MCLLHLLSLVLPDLADTLNVQIAGIQNSAPKAENVLIQDGDYYVGTELEGLYDYTDNELTSKEKALISGTEQMIY